MSCRPRGSQLIFLYIYAFFENTCMIYDFDEVIPRKGTGCAKYDFPEVGDCLPLWVADMDFRTPDFIIDALKRRLDHPVLGCPAVPEDYYKVISAWVKSIHAWEVDPAHIRFIPGIVRGIGMVLNCFYGSCAKQVKVIIQTPVYHPFRILPEKNGFEVVFNPLKDGHMDLDHLESIIDERTKVLVLANPHNPIGICWSREELQRLAHICHSRGVLVISDEIHSEMVHRGYRHYPFTSVSDEAAACSLCFMAPSKTFNIAGVVSSYVIVPDASLREKFFKYLESNEFDFPPIFSIVATEAAYTKGGEWREQMLCYVEDNIDFVEDFLKKNIPQIKAVRPQASFLIWLDCSGLGLDHDSLIGLFTEKAGLYLNDGEMFGPGGEGHMRLNVGCPRSVLETALEKLKTAIYGK